MSWMTELCSKTPKGEPVEYQTRALAHHSYAERPDRVKVSGRVIHTGYVSDHNGYRLYVELIHGTAYPPSEEMGHV